MRRASILALVCVLAGLITKPATAGVVTLVDTGLATEGLVNGLGVENTEFIFDTHRLFAARFDLDQRSTLTSLEVGIKHNDFTIFGSDPIFGNDFILSLVGDAANLPDEGTVFLDPTGFEASSTFGWQGVSGLNLTLDPGDYWLVVDAALGSSGFLFGGPPQSEEATGYARRVAASLFGTFPWTPLENGPISQGLSRDSFSIRVKGLESAPAVPEPASICLLCLGAGGLTLLRRRLTLA